MDIQLILLYIVLIYLYVIMYITKGEGLWNNVEIYTPGWSEKYLVYLMIYLFITFIGMLWVFSLKSNNLVLRNSQSLIAGTVLILFAFTIYCLTADKTSIEEAFIISSVILAILVYNFISIFTGNSSSLAIFAILPLTVYGYLYAWVYEIKNSY